MGPGEAPPRVPRGQSTSALGRFDGLGARVASAVVDWPGLWLAAWAVAAAVCAFFAVGLLAVVRAAYEPEPGMESYAARQAWERHFPTAAGDASTESVILETRGDLDVFVETDLLRNVTEALDEVVERTRSEFPGLHIDRRSWRPGEGAGQPSASYESGLGASRQRLFQVVWGGAAGGPDRADVQAAAAVLVETVRRLNRTWAPHGLQLVATGPNVLQLAARAQAWWDIGVHALMFLPVAALCMHFHLRRWQLLVLPVVCAVFACVLAFAAASFIARRCAVDQNVPTMMAFLSVGLCVDWSFFLLARFREEETSADCAEAALTATASRRSREATEAERATALAAAATREAVRLSLLRTGGSVLLSGALIVACSGCLVVAMPRAIASHALGASLATAASMLVCLTFLPACLAMRPWVFGSGELRARLPAERGHIFAERTDSQSSIATLDTPTSGTLSSPPPEHDEAGDELWFQWATCVTLRPCNVWLLLCALVCTIPFALQLHWATLSVSEWLSVGEADPALLAYDRLRVAFPRQAPARTQLHILLETRPQCAPGVRSSAAFRSACEAAKRALDVVEDTMAGTPSVLGVVALPPSLQGDAESALRCIPWRLHFSTAEEALDAVEGNFTPSAHLLLTGRTRYAVGLYGEQWLMYRSVYQQLWARCVSKDQKAMLLSLHVPWDTMSWQGFGLVEALRASLRSPGIRNESDPCGDVSVWELSETGVWRDFVACSIGAMPSALALAVSVSWCILVMAFGSCIVATKLVGTVVVPLVWVFGTAFWWFRGAHGGLHWTVPCSTSMLLVALALDYNVFLFSRALEFRRAGAGDVEAVRRGLSSTGPVITCAGAIFALEFSGLYFSQAPLERQAGFVVVVGVLFDTVAVRSMLLPAALSLGAKRNWPADIRPSSGKVIIGDEGL